MSVRTLVATLVAGLVAASFAASARAQEATRDPSELDERESPAPAPPPTTKAAADDGLARLREIEGRLSVGQPLTEAEERVLTELSARGGSAEERALATAILPWLPPATSAPALLDAAGDADARVRSQATQGLVAVAKRVAEGQRAEMLRAGVRLLDDPDDDVACNAGRLLMALSPPLAVEQLKQRAVDASPVRYGCFQRLAGLPVRPVSVPPPTPPRGEGGDGGDGTPKPLSAPPPPKEPTGDLVFVAAAAGAGFMAGGLLPGIALPARDTLTYARDRTTHTREETSVLTAGGSALVGALALGGGAWALTELVGPMDFPSASGVVLGSTAGALGGFGLALAGSFNDSVTGLSAVGGGLLGLSSATALAYTFPPTAADIGFATAAGGQAALLGTLVAFAAVPVGTDLVFERTKRLDFGFGVGLLTGGAITTAALWATPFVELHPGRVLVSSAAGLAGAALGVGLGYLFVPVSIDVRGRIASGVGAGLQLIGAALAFVLVPDDWADAVMPTDQAVAGKALFLDEGRLRLGLPSVDLLPRPEGLAVSVGLVGGRF